MAEERPNARDAKLIQYLNEAYGNEKRLETALEAHIGMAIRAPYKRRLREHLTETRRHARDVSRRIEQLGGEAGVAAVLAGAAKATALASAPLQALRGTSDEEKQLKNAKTEYTEEAREIGMYTAIQTFAENVGDRETAALVRSIMREEHRMFAFLEKEIGRLATAAARAEVPAALRSSARPRRAATRRPSTTASTSDGRGSRSRSATSRAASTRSRSRSGAASSRSGSTASRGRSASSRSGGNG
jgi:ferritin-like metal-binding protein YciE